MLLGMAGEEQYRCRPNILICGTPDVGMVAKENNLFEGWDEQYECPILDEDKVVDELEGVMGSGGNVVEYHSCEFFPERWFDAVFVLRADNTVLYDRLVKRSYSEKKISENIQCEIFQSILEEARESYPEGIVHELISNLPEDLDRNVDAICEMVDNWSPDMR
ncbi:hypothetical protein EMCRGX_G021734 [Ephydatia muelleri]